MIVTSTFKVDLFQLKHAKDPEGLLQAMKDANAAELGRKLIELFPYEKVAGFEGVLPEMSLNREHEFTDTWGVELVVMDAKVIRDYIKQLNNEAEELVQEYNDQTGAEIKLAKAEIFQAMLQ